MNQSRLLVSLIALLMGCGTDGEVETKVDTTSGAGGAKATSSQSNGGTSGAATSRESSGVTEAKSFTGKCEVIFSEGDLDWDTNAEAKLVLSDSGSSSNSDAVSVDGGVVTIKKAGTYRLSGRLSSGRVVVDAPDSGIVRLVLDNAEIISAMQSALQIIKADKAVVILVEGSENRLADSANYADGTSDNAVLFSQENLIIGGSGKLTVAGNYQDGISSKDGLLIRSGTLRVSAIDDGIRGKDCLSVWDGDLAVEAGGDGIKADNTDDSSLGYVFFRDGSVDVKAGGDGVSAETSVYVTGGKFAVNTGGGNEKTISDDVSAKGFKGGAGVVVDGGDFAIDSADDAIHGGGTVILNGGSFDIASGDDGIHSDCSVTLGAPKVIISKSYEGIEGTTITLTNAETYITSSDDGINASDGSGESTFGGPGGMGPAFPGMGTIPPNPWQAGAGGASGFASFTSGAATSALATSLLFQIDGGKLVVDASGDGLDSNGNIIMTGGTVLVSGPTDNGNGAIDIGDGGAYSFKISGGFLVAAGSAGMAIAPTASSTQNSVLVTTSGAAMGGPPQMGSMGSTAGIVGGTLFHIQNAAGDSLLSFAPAKRYASVVFSSKELVAGSYAVFTGGSDSGTELDSLFSLGSYSGGEKQAEFVVGSTTVTTCNWSL